MNKCKDKGKRAYHLYEIEIFSLSDFLNKIMPFFLKGAG